MHLAGAKYLPFYLFLLFLLVSWQILYPKNKQAALYSILLATCTSLTLCLSPQPVEARMLLAPLVTWLFFAAKMNSDVIADRAEA